MDQKSPLVLFHKLWQTLRRTIPNWRRRLYGIKRFHICMATSLFYKQIINHWWHFSVRQRMFLVKHQVIFNVGPYCCNLTNSCFLMHSNADPMSRLHLPDTPVSTPVPRTDDWEIGWCSYIIHANCKTDPILSKVFQYILLGWPSKVDNQFTPYWNRRLELSTHAGCILSGVRVIVPPQGQSAVLAELHGGHPGITRMKALAPHLVWWLKLDKDVMTVSRTEPLLLQCHFILGNGPLARGQDYM